MGVKSPSPKRFRVQIAVELDALDRAAALAKAQEITKGNPAAKIKIQEAYLAWMTVATPQTADAA